MGTYLDEWTNSQLSKISDEFNFSNFNIPSTSQVPHVDLNVETPNLLDKGSSVAGDTNLLGTAYNTISKYMPYVTNAPLAYGLATNPNTTVTNAISNPINGAMTGAGLGSFAGPVGSVVGGLIGAGVGAIGSLAGYGKTKYTGYSSNGGTYNQGGNLTRLANQGQYNNYNDAMNYLNNWNAQNTNGWNWVGDSEVGQDNYKTKKVFKNKKTSTPVWSANLNTGYNVLDDYTNGRNYIGGLDLGWQPYADRENRIYQNRWNGINDRMNYDVNNLLSDYNVNSMAREINDSQMAKAKNVLDAQLNRGYLTQRAYREALRALQQQSYNNYAGLRDIGNNEVNTWKTDLTQAYQNNMDTPTDTDWIKYYGGMNYDNSKALGALNNYWNTYVNDDIIRSLMSQGNTYQPYQYVATGVGKAGIGNSLNDWYNGTRRKAQKIYEGE